MRYGNNSQNHQYPTNIFYIPDFFLLPLADPVKTAVGLEKENYSYNK